MKAIDIEAKIKFLDLFFISMIGLYFEILYIRWFPTNIQIVAYFTNIILISSFLGLGLGCLLADIRYDLMLYFPLSLLTLAIIGVGFSRLPVYFYANAEHLLGIYRFGGHNYLTLLMIIFIFNVIFFVILGQVMGRSLRSFKPLTAYSINIAGSICGVIIFWVLSYLGASPIRWFAIGIIMSLWFVVRARKALAISSIFLILTISLIVQFSGNSLWSPYYKIDTVALFNEAKRPMGYEISVNKTQHQFAFDFSNKGPSWDIIENFRNIYELPYKFYKPDDVLVVGAGSGNEVAISIEMGAKKIDAVEIDPVIAKMGYDLHPQRPYLDEKVSVFVDDARSFLNKTNRGYDLIVFGYLDAHRLLSGFSTVRLDNFIYTVKSFNDAKKCLKSDGILVVTYLIFRDWIATRLQKELEEVFGKDLFACKASAYRHNDTIVFFAGPGIDKIRKGDIAGFDLVDIDDKKEIDITPATDDWPYLYLLNRSIPKHYIIVLLSILILSIIIIYSALKEKIKHMRHYHFFFLGVAFMLIETKSITRFALLYGSTWVVNTAVITSILSVILIANFIVSRIRICRLGPYYILLMGSILLEWCIDTSIFLSFNRAAGLILSSMLLAFPLLFAAIIFAISFKRTNDPSGVFAFNLTGAVLGGVLEYGAMIYGFRSLSLIALAMYAVSYFAYRKKLI